MSTATAAAPAFPIPEPCPCRTEGAAAAAALRAWRQSPAGLLFIAADERQAETMAALLRAFAPEAEPLVLPAWDCLPYDRVPPSPGVAGSRLACLQALAPARCPLVVASIEAVLQKLPLREQILPLGQTLNVGSRIDSEALATLLQDAGYVEDERVDEPGEMQRAGQVLNVFPAGADLPVRIEWQDGGIVDLRRYDPLTQRSTEPVDTLAILPTREPAVTSGTASRLLDWLPDAAIVMDARVPNRRAAFVALVADSHAMARRMRALHAAAAPEALYWRMPLKKSPRGRRDDADDAMRSPLPRLRLASPSVHSAGAWPAS